MKKTTDWPAVYSSNAAIYFIKKYTSLNIQEISTLFNGLGKSSISQMSRRFCMALEDKAIKMATVALENEIAGLTAVRGH